MAVGVETGMTSEEAAIMGDLIAAAERFNALERQHPDELRDFTDGIHRCQYLLAMRVVRRVYPVRWPNKGET